MRVPSKSSVGVYYPERVEGGVHDLSGAEQVQDHRDAEVSDQEPEGDVHHLADAAACSGHESRAEECDFAASSQLSSCTPGGIAGPPPGRPGPRWVLTAARLRAWGWRTPPVTEQSLPRAMRYRWRDLPFSK